MPQRLVVWYSLWNDESLMAAVPLSSPDVSFGFGFRSLAPGLPGAKEDRLQQAHTPA